jgi:hypothetical protein
MRSPQTRDKWTINMRATVLVAMTWVLAALLFASLHRGPGDTKWHLAEGSIQDTRLVADHALQTKWGGQLTWRGEYKVVYSVAGREYAVWADSGIRGEDEDGVRLALPHSRRASCRVRYNPQKPEASVADCR